MRLGRIGNYPRESLALYAFSWQFDGNCGYVEAGDCLYRFCPPSDVEEECWGEGLPLEEALAFDRDLSDFYEMIKGDPLLGCVAERFPGLRPRKLSVWSSLVIGVAQQNASFKQAWKSIYRLHILYSKRIKAFGKEYLLFPKMEDLDAEAFKRAGFGYRARVFEGVKGLSLNCSTIEELKMVKGVGDYTLGLVKLFGCADYSATILDRWLRAVYEKAYGDLDVYFQFGKWKGLVSLLTTVALDAVPLRKALERVERRMTCPMEEPSPLTLWKFY